MISPKAGIFTLIFRLCLLFSSSFRLFYRILIYIAKALLDCGIASMGGGVFLHLAPNGGFKRLTLGFCISMDIHTLASVYFFLLLNNLGDSLFGLPEKSFFSFLLFSPGCSHSGHVQYLYFKLKGIHMYIN